MALTKTISANGSRGHQNFILNVSEDSTSGNNSFLSFEFKIEPIQSGWDWYGWGNSISYSVNIGGNVYNGTIPSYDGYSSVLLKKETNIIVPHNTDGTKTIQISFNVSDSTGQSYTCGSASTSANFALSNLHRPPYVESVEIQELNSELISLGIENDKIVQNLSMKKFIVSAISYDSARINDYTIWHNNAMVGQSTNNEINVNFGFIADRLITENIDGELYASFRIRLRDNRGGTSNIDVAYKVLKYTKPALENTSSNIKRKTGYSVNLTDNKATLNIVGTFYKNTVDNIGINNSITVQYKIWQANTTEPDYINNTDFEITPVEGNPLLSNITLKDFELTNIIYTNVYNYKIKIEDSYGKFEEKEGVVPTGVSVWTEYKNRVDFKRATINGLDVLKKLDENQSKIAETLNGKPVYVKTLIFNDNITQGSSINHGIYNYDNIWIDLSNSFVQNQNISYPLPIILYGTGSQDKLCPYIDGSYIKFHADTSWGNSWAKIITIKYTKSE